MSLNDLLSKIQKDAKAEAEKIKKEASIRVAEIRRENQSKLDEIKKKNTLEIKKEAEKKIFQEKFLAEQILNSEILKVKKEILEKIIEKFSGELSDLDEKEQEKIFCGFSEQIGELKDAEILVSSSSEEAVKSIFGQKAEIKKDKNISFGFYVKSKKVEWDFTLTSILERFKNEHLDEMGKIAFE